jgi:hypothetical protein
VINNVPSGKQYTLDPKMTCDADLLDAALSLTAKGVYMRNLMLDERIDLMKRYQSNCTHVIVRADGQKVYGRLTGDVIESTNLS